MEKEKFNSLINEINKIARLNILQYKIEKIVEEYDEFIEDFYFIEWLRLSTNNYTEKEELNNTLELFEELLEEIEIAIFNDKDKLIKYCQGIQMGSPIDSNSIPEPWDMPGYTDQVIMAAGAFTQGSSIELSCDGPIREPYTAFMQGGLTYEYGKIGVLKAIEFMQK